ncbi:hypothetical protein [Candidatus Electronema sp. TJ]|uniref:hypothetical protein n=1 Tax=Candidatus Electronema sp. TJ TaxID=3401573 RepID=UPI003AA90433
MFSPHLDKACRRAVLLLLTVLLLLPLPACGSQELMQAAASYRQRKDSASLEIIHLNLHRGMPQAEVEGLLGEPDYSPIEGQQYYASRWDGTKQSGPPPTLVVDYRDAQGGLTAVLHDFWLGTAGE